MALLGRWLYLSNSLKLHLASKSKEEAYHSTTSCNKLVNLASIGGRRPLVSTRLVLRRWETTLHLSLRTSQLLTVTPT